MLPGIRLSEVTINPLTCTGLMTHDVRGPEGVEDVAGVVGEGAAAVWRCPPMLIWTSSSGFRVRMIFWILNPVAVWR